MVYADDTALLGLGGIDWGKSKASAETSLTAIMARLSSNILTLNVGKSKDQFLDIDSIEVLV